MSSSSSSSAVETTVEKPAEKIPHRLQSIDFLRGVAALAVVITHSFHFGGEKVPPEAWFRHLLAAANFGWLGVPLFFVISGFCIHAPWAKHFARTGESRVDFKTFWKRRIRRLYPPYFIVLCVGMALMVVSYKQGHSEIYPDPKPLWLGLDFLAHVFMLHGLHPLLDQAGGTPPMWTLAREEYFYLMYFGLLAWRRTRGVAFALVCVYLTGALFEGCMMLLLPAEASIKSQSADSWWSLTWRLAHSSAPTLWMQWALGFVAAENYFGLIKLPRWCRMLWLVPVYLILAVNWPGVRAFFTPTLYGLAFFTILTYCVEREKAGHWPQNWLVTILAGVGTFSYSLYLVHSITLRLLDRLLPAPALTAQTPWAYLAWEIVLLALCLCAGKAFYMLVERHFLNKPTPDTLATNATHPEPATLPAELAPVRETA